ncbi:MAG: M28 family peptidase [Thermoleophilia bacterium]|nr:M28 family peptidase [Thermoleophilia bacterium]
MRVGFVVVVPALLALLFSLSTPGTLPRSPLDPLFDADAAAVLHDQLSTQYPARVPGTVEAEGAARWYRETISALGLATEEDVWTADLADLGRVELRNIVTVVPGRADETVVVVAHRDNAGTNQPRGDNASGTATLIELARGFAPQEIGPDPMPQRTLVLVSTDAGAYGGAGAARFAETSSYAGTAIAAVVLDGLRSRGRPRIAIAGDSPASPARALVSTASARIREQVGVAPALPSALTQLVDLGLPFAAGEQGPFLKRGVAAITVTTSEKNDAVPAGDRDTRVSVRRLGQLGRATEALVGSLDASVGRAFRTPDSLFFNDRAASGWAVRLTLVLCVVPFALGVFDLLVRCRRRALPMAPAFRGLRSRFLFWLYGGLLVWTGALTGVFPTGSPLPLPPYTALVTDTPAAGLTLLALALALGWLGGRKRLIPVRPADASEQLAGLAAALVGLGVLALALALAKPYALVFVLPSLYAWMWLPLRRRLWQRALLFGIGLAGPFLGFVMLSRQLDLGVIDTPLYVLGLTTVGYLSLGSALAAIAWAAVTAQLAALAFGRYAPYAQGTEPPPPGVVRRSLRRVFNARQRPTRS